MKHPVCATCIGVLVFALGSAALPDAAPAQQPPVRPVLSAVDTPVVDTPAPGVTATVGHTFFPERRDATDQRISGIRLPAGFRIGVFARGLGAPRMIEVADDGWIYVTRPDSGDVVALRDADGDGSADQRRTVVSGISHVHGIALSGSRVYLVDVNHVYEAERRADGSLGEPRRIGDALPDGGQHSNRTIEVGGDGMLYITVGSLTNAWPAPAEREATMLRMRPDGSGLEIYARNLRNTLGFGWHPASGEMWGMDHGIDWLGDDAQPEELNRIVQGKDYGWPFCYGNRTPNPTRPAPRERGFESKDAYCATTEPMVLGYTAHSAPMGLAFYTGTRFPADYRGDAFVAMRGSWNRYPPSGYEVVRIDFDEQGRPERIEPFATGWLTEDGRAHFGRPVGLAESRDGSLLLSDDVNGMIYRIWYDAARR